MGTLRGRQRTGEKEGPGKAGFQAPMSPLQMPLWLGPKSMGPPFPEGVPLLSHKIWLQGDAEALGKPAAAAFLLLSNEALTDCAQHTGPPQG